MSERLTKDQMLQHWQTLTRAERIPIRKVPYKHEGSTYSEDGIRITGTREFIDAVLSRLTDLLEHENGTTRLHVTYQRATDRQTRAELASWSCYVQVHERGGKAQMMNTYLESVRGKRGAE